MVNAGADCRSSKKNLSPQPDDLARMDGLWTNANGKIWVPEDATDLQLRLCIITNTGSAGDRGRNVTARTLCSKYHWLTKKENVRTFVRACFHCVSALGGEKIPHPFGPAVYGTKTNDLM